MTCQLSVDLGTTFTAAAVLDGSVASMVGLGNRALQVPSVLFWTGTTFLVGEAAERRGAVEPDRLVREFKRRLGDDTPLLVGGASFTAEALTAHLLRWVVDTVTATQGGPPAGLVLTHPANWGPYKLEVMREVVALAGVGPATWCVEPVAAAARYAARARLAPGARLAVYDLGGGTFDACVLERTADGFTMLGTPEGIEHLGGADLDHAVFRHVVAGLGDRLDGVDLTDEDATADLARLRRECVEAKEELSSQRDTLVPVAVAGVTATVRLTRDELEGLVRAPLEDTVSALRRAVRTAGLGEGDLTGIVLVGGSSRIPLVGELLERAFGVPTALDTHPKHDVALGALLPSASGTVRASARGSSPAAPVPPAPVPPAPTPVAPAVLGPAVSSPALPARPADDPGTQNPPTPHPSRRRALLVGAAAAIVVAAVVVALVVRGGGGSTAGPAPLPPAASTSPTPGNPTPGNPSAGGPTLPRSAPLAADQLVVSMQVRGDWNLYLASTEAATLRPLTSGPAADYTAVLSPDRSTVVYQHDPDVTDDSRTLRVAGAADGSDARELFATVPDVCAGLMYRPAWDPVDPTELAVPCTDRRGRYGLYLVRTDGTVLQRVPTAGDRTDDPSFAPDGRLVFWAATMSAEQRARRSLADGVLYVREVDGTIHPLPGVGGTGRDADAAWSPDGRSIVFRRRVPNGTTKGNLDILVVPADGSAAPTPLADDPDADEEDPTWSSDGREIAFKSTRTTRAQPEALARTWVMDADGGRQRLLLPDDADHPQTAPAWSRR